MKSKLAIILVFMFATAGCSTVGVKSASRQDNASETALLYNEFIQGPSPNIAQLTLFFSKMPKGADLHHHYSGSIYAETYLDWFDCCIDKNTLRYAEEKTENTISVAELRADDKLYRKLLTLWSDMDYHNHYHEQISPDLNFFNTFGYFGHVPQRYDEGLRIIRERALSENVAYVETMFKSAGYSLEDPSFDENIEKAADDGPMASLFDRLSEKMEADPELAESIDELIRTIETAHREIDDDRFMMRYQAYATRNSSPSEVFSALYSAFKAVDACDLLVGVNIVGPENGDTAIADYRLHMRMFAYLHEKFPGVNRALHAGELTLGMVRPKDLKFHIAEAVRIAAAQRIGHGVDLPYEDDAVALLKQMKEKTAVEICLTSNEFILGVEGDRHPYLIYFANDIPMVICTDDSGVSRNNLTGEYVLLASRYKPSYETVKKYVYNSIKYSFLSEGDKQKLTGYVDTGFSKFEAEMAEYRKMVRR